MSVDSVEKGSFTVIGKVGQGLSADSTNWIPALWQEANRKFDEIQKLAKLDDEGNIVGIWGAMSDVNERFERWTDEGKYLAGCEVLDGSVAPAGWTRWVIPSYRYAVIQCNPSTYQVKFNEMVYWPI